MIDLDRLDTDPTYRTPRNADDMRTRNAALNHLANQAPAQRTTDFVRTAAQASPKQVGYVMVLLRLLDAHNAGVAATAREWFMDRAIKDDDTGRVVGTTLNRDQVSDVINRLKGHLDGPAATLEGVVSVVKTDDPTPAPTATRSFDKYDDVTDGNYAITAADGKNHFYRITRKEGKGKYAGRTFINIQERASDELFPVRGPWATRARILDAIRAAGVDAAHLAYATLLGRCWHCHAELTDNTGNPYFHLGLGPICGGK